MSVVSDSAVCRNLRGWIPAAGTLCATNHHVPDRQRRWQWEETGLKADTKGLTFSWSWTLAPFFSRVSTTLECPYWEATVRAVPPSCHEKTHTRGHEKNKPAVRKTRSRERTSLKPDSVHHFYLLVSTLWITVWDDSIAAASITPSVTKTVTCVNVHRCIPLSGIQWRHRTQRGASQRHCDRAARQRTGL